MQMQRPDVRAEAERAVAALQEGDFATARDAFRVVTSSGAASTQAWLFYAQACEGCGDWEHELVAIDQVLETDKQNPFALLMKGDIFARKGDDRAAVSFYRRGMRRCAELSELPGDLPERLEKAAIAVEQAECRFTQQLERQLVARGLAETPQRVAEALAIATGSQPIYLQQPTSFYFPGLPQKPWYDARDFGWASTLEDAAPQMRAEVERVIADEARLTPYVEESGDRASRGHSLLNDPRWSALHLWKDGSIVEENASRCPLVMKLLEQVPLPRVQSRSPMALISVLRPGTHIPPHTGMLNTRLICHIPLIVPRDCRLRVGSETREVIEGKAMIFDDSIEHEAWNNGSSARAVLLFEFWRPEINEEERVALTAMFESISAYERGFEA